MPDQFMIENGIFAQGLVTDRASLLANESTLDGATLVFHASDGKWHPEVAASGGVTDVTAASPLASSGGNTPQISLASAVPVSKGGTGSTTGSAAGLNNIPAAQVVGQLALANMPPLVVTKYTTAGSYSFTANAATRLIVCAMCGGGGAGASGRQGTAAVSAGGGAGGGGGFTMFNVLPSDLTFPVNITVGAGGVGGAAQASPNSNGNPGTDSGASSFGSYFRALGGTRSSFGGENVSGFGNPGGAAMFQGLAGGNGVINAAPTNGSTSSSGFACGGGGGGGGPQAATFSKGANAVVLTVFNLTQSLGGQTAGAAGADGAAVTFYPAGGSGGGGGASGDSAGTVAGGRGGNGGAPGGGGGGGGGSVNGAASGAGGNGADGCVWIFEF